MFSVTGFKYRFTPSWQMFFLACLVAGLFMRLGFWQLQRAEEKRNMLATQHAMTIQKPVSWKISDSMPEQYQLLKIEGKFLPPILLLDNQHIHHQFGYDVISPLLLADGRVVLVDRGWVSGDVSRQTFPEVSLSTGTIKLVGSVFYPSSKTWVLGPSLEQIKSDLAIIELFDMSLISQFLHKSVYPFIIRLGREEQNGFTRKWPVVAMLPERHVAYALQWFALALVVVILFVVHNMKKKI